MYSAKVFRVLLVAFSVLSVAQASGLDYGRPIDAAVVRRQDATGTGNDDSSTTSRTSTTSETSTTDSTTSPTGDPDDPTTPPTRTSSSSSSTTDQTEPTDDPDTETDEPITETRTQIITTTNSDGQLTSFTTQQTLTRTPGLSNSDAGGASGMTKETRNIVIGVVVGVGGAIVLGALGFVAWRIWGRKKQAEEQDAMNWAPAVDKSEASNSPPGTTGAARNPFQQTLETYHAPTQVNASSNF